MLSHIRSFFCHTTQVLLLFALTSCGSTWVQYQQRKVGLTTQLATGKISGRIYDQKLAELEKWYARGGRTSSGSGRRSGSGTTKSSDGNKSEASTTKSSSPSASGLNKLNAHSSDSMQDVTRKTKSGINEF